MPKTGKRDNSALLAREGKSSSEKRRDSVERREKAELARLQRVTKDALPEDVRSMAMPLLHNLAFLKVKLEDTKAELRGEPAFIEYDNGGGQTGLREHPGFSAYNKLFTTYCRAVKQLTDLMPHDCAAGDELLDYLRETSDLT